MGRFEQVFWEYGSEAKSSRTSVHTINLTNANTDAQLALAVAFSDAVADLSLGTPGTLTIVASEAVVGKTPSADPQAQRENKWLVSFVDIANGNAGSFTIPCADLDQLSGDGQTVDITAGNGLALVTATEAYIRSVAGNAVTVTSIRFSARTI